MNALYLTRSYMVLNDVGRLPTEYCERYSDVIRPNLPNCLRPNLPNCLNAIESLESKHASTGPACSSVLRTSLLPAPAPAVHIVTFTPFTDTQIQYTLYTGPSALLLSLLLLLPIEIFRIQWRGVTSVSVYFCFGEFYLHWAKISLFIQFGGLPIPVGIIFLLQKRHCTV